MFLAQLKLRAKIVQLACFGITSLGVCGCAASTQNTKPDDNTGGNSGQTKRQQVVDLLKSFETGAAEPAQVINPEQYTQHNLAVADGLAGFQALMQQVPQGSVKVNTVRVFQEGDFIFTHTDYNFFGPKIGFDVFRFENGRIVEHWDNLQETAGPNPSAHTMIDGTTQAADLQQTAANKQFVSQFVEEILVAGHLDKLPEFIGPEYVQHNPNIADGLAGLKAGLEALAKQGIHLKYEKVHRVLGEGNFVLTLSEGDFGGKPTAFYDLFRVQAGKLAEHWDTLETIPPREQWKNPNGKF